MVIELVPLSAAAYAARTAPTREMPPFASNASACCKALTPPERNLCDNQPIRESKNTLDYCFSSNVFR
jgi:hypothetical protein